MKHCSNCKVELTDETGYRRKQGPDAGAFKNLCRDCGSKASSSWAKRNPERHNANGKNWNLKHPSGRLAILRKYNRDFRDRLNSLKSERPCYDCGGTFPPEAMDFDHVRGEKAFGVSVGAGKGWDEVRKEIDKCDLVCACCHRVRTQKRFCVCLTTPSNP